MVPQFPQPPTDNLYKFIAIFGLVLFIVGVGLPTYAIRDLADKEQELVGRTEATTRDVIFKTADLLSKDKFESHEQKMAALDQAGKDVAAFAKKSHEAAAQQSQWQRDYAKWLSKSGERLAVLSLVVMVFGFALWYYRVQRKQDAILDCEVAKAKSEMANIPGAPPHT